MQFLPPINRDKAAARREKPAGTHLPYARHVDDVTLQLRDGMLMQTVHLGGLLFETADSDELNYRAELRDTMLRAIGSSRFAVYHHLIRRRADVSLLSDYADDFSTQLDRRWRDRLADKQMFINELFVTIVRRPLQGRLGWTDRLRGIAGKAVERRDVALAAERRALDAAREAITAALSQYSPRTLGIYETADGYRSEPLEFLSCLFNGEMRPVGLPHGDLGMHLPWRRVSFGQDTIELGPAAKFPRRFSALVSIKDYPGQTMPGMFDELYRLPFEMTVTQSFAFNERSEALGRMHALNTSTRAVRRPA